MDKFFHWIYTDGNSMIFCNKKVSLILSSNNDAGIPDLRRFQRVFPGAKIYNFYGLSWRKKLFLLFDLFREKNRIFFHTQSDKIGLLIKIFVPAYHIQVVHVQRGFVFAQRLRILHKILFFLNRTLCNERVFLSQHVLDSYGGRGKLIKFEKYLNFTNKKIKKPDFLFFFGRDEAYKNLDFFLQLALSLPSYKFEIYSNNFKPHRCVSSNVTVVNRRLSDDEVLQLYERNGVLILPYLEVSQSGPFFLALEHGLNVVVPINSYFENYANTDGVFLIDELSIEAWKNVVERLVERESPDPSTPKRI